MSTCISVVREVWILTARNTGFADRYVVGVYTSEQLAEDSCDELGDQIENTRIEKNFLFKRRDHG